MTEPVSHRVLVVDDEPDITALVAYHLAKAVDMGGLAGDAWVAFADRAQERRIQFTVRDR